jgi:hypothetical protein
VATTSWNSATPAEFERNLEMKWELGKMRDQHCLLPQDEIVAVAILAFPIAMSERIIESGRAIKETTGWSQVG